MATRLAGAGAGLVIGGHAHVVQPMVRLGDTLVAYSLHGLANVALAEGQAKRAVVLLSAVKMIYEKHPAIPLRRRQFELSLTRSRDALDPAAFDVAWREGQQTPLEQIVAHGLGITN